MSLFNRPARKAWRARCLCYAFCVLGAFGCGSVDESETQGVQQALAPAGSDSELLGASFKSSWYPGERVRVAFSLRNSGTVDWTAADPTFAFASLDRAWVWRYTSTTVTVPVGSSHDFDFVVSAPSAPGNYSFIARMRAIGLGDFGETATRSATVTTSATPEWQCEYVASQSDVPTQLAPNENRAVTVTVRNTGQHAWQPQFYLGSRDMPRSLWRQTVEPLEETLAVGASKTWHFGIRAPAQPGTYAFLREMHDGSSDGVGAFRLSNYCVNLSIEVGGITPLDSSLVSQDFPAAVFPGDAFTTTVVLSNTGLETWLADGSYVLGSRNSPPSLWGKTILPLKTPTPPGASVSVVLPLRAPTLPGTYEEKWQLRKLSGSNAGYYGSTVTAAVVVDPAVQANYAAGVVSQTIPTRMVAGSDYPAAIYVQNTGRMTWTGASFGLVSTNLPEALWTTTRTPLAAAESVAPGATRRFSFNLRAPTSAGSYVSSWRMAQTGSLGLFGDTARVDGIEVTLCGNRSVDPGETCDDGNWASGDGCSPTCQRECGNGQIDPNEGCDGTDLAGATCESLTSGTHVGTLSCRSDCQFDLTGCQPKPTPCSESVVFEDPTVEAAVLAQLGKTAGPVTPEEAAELYDVWIEGPSTYSLKGLECFTNLISLTVWGTQVSDLTPLAGLTHLFVLEMVGNQLQDLTPLANLTELRNLGLSENRIASVRALSGLTHLQALDLQWNQIESLEGLANKPELTSLMAAANLVTDLAPLTGLPQLSQLLLFTNRVSDLGPLASLPQLSYLDAENNLISTLAPLVQNASLGAGDMVYVPSNPLACPYEWGNIDTLRARGVNVVTDCVDQAFIDPNLERVVRIALGKPTGRITPADAARLRYLDASGSSISSLGGLEAFTNLQNLALANNDLVDVRPLSALINLTGLDLSGNRITDVAALAGLTGLSSLDLGDNQIADVTGLAPLQYLRWLRLDNNVVNGLQPLTALTRMEYLRFVNNRVQSLQGLSAMTALGLLAFDGNAVSDLAPLANLVALRDLRFSSNQVTSLSPLAGLPLLTTLDGTNNLITDLSPLAALTPLQRVYLSKNRVSTLAPLLQTSGIGAGDALDLQENPLDCATETSNAQAILARGVVLRTDCGPGESCVDRELVGTYGVQLHNEIQTCSRSNFACSSPSVEEASATLRLYTMENEPGVLQGELNAPGIHLGRDMPLDTFMWVYYPGPDDHPSIWEQYYPSDKLGLWDEQRASDWVRVNFEVCWPDFPGLPGFVHIDVELATGRIIGFARKCRDDYYETFWTDYRLTGTGQLICAAD